MLDKIKSIGDWWGDKASSKKLSILNLVIIISLGYLYYRDDGRFESDIKDCREINVKLSDKLFDLERRHYDYRLRTDKQIQKMQEDFNKEKVRINERLISEYRELFEKTDRFYHKSKITK